MRSRRLRELRQGIALPDSGIRRGSDIVTALALGARAVLVGVLRVTGPPGKDETAAG